ncbi:class I SAM-dependent methyltransferase [Desemzia sp. RIT804]|uniref:class I SAM-dependent methyltransferase n=1 Tax=Desemzia sp. RIT 804 TaxID=2810209 RepID=UPI0019516B41|nr:class I SAM-dependent methyltransferase [Desemzia sp. RIT 804]MBM6615572.1 class I SAM-dependent methyltransferase [Desemzia sp. RIT 804]
MKTSNIDAIAKSISPTGALSEIQMVQTQHRIHLAKYWEIQTGERILEIGCGQGDTTAVLAYFVGDKGTVHAIDIASPDYGAPETLEQAMSKLKQSSVGDQITVDFNTDILSPEIDFPENTFDTIILSHSSWYLNSQATLFNMFVRFHKWGKRLAFAEWDSRISESHQLPHFLAALLQAQYESFRESSEANIRTLITPEDSKALAKQAGWEIIDETIIPSQELQDGGWEVDMTLYDAPEAIVSIPNMPDQFKTLLYSQLNLLKSYNGQEPIQSMDTFSFIAIK